MMSSRRHHAQRSPRRAALFIDYANLYRLLAERLDAAPERAGAYITEAVRALRRSLEDEDRTDTVLMAAYADFGALESGAPLQETLYQKGIEPRFVPASPRESPPEVQLSIDATALLHRRPDVQTVALLAGDRPFLPLVKALRQQGARAVVALLDAPPTDAYGADDVYVDFLSLLDDSARRHLLHNSERPARREAAEESSPAYDRLDDEMLFRTLEVTEEHFGQYDEVYLTPLLRKLSDVLGERFDPKALVSALEDAGAVRLAKRRGYPYDYTVLIVERDHPDVQDVRDEFYDGDPSPYGRAGADYDRSEDAYEETAHESRSPGGEDYEDAGFENEADGEPY